MQKLCQHFRSCGGCSLQHIDYVDQVKRKEEELTTLFSMPIEVVGAPNPFEYRNRVDFVYTDNGLSFRQKGKYNHYENIRECLLLPPFMRSLFTQINESLLQKKYAMYDLDSHEGFLRYVVFRYSQKTKEVMVICTTNTPNNEEKSSFEVFMKDLAKKVTSAYWFINDSKTDISIPYHKPKLCIGEKYISDIILDTKYNYGPHSFFQSNTQVTELIFAQIQKEVCGTTVDVCCGVGAITLIAATKATTITGIEQVEEAIMLAKENARQNNITNATFFVNDSKKILEHVSLDVDTVIVDPPRAGLDKKTIERIRLLEPKKIIYMSCNPKSQKHDFTFLLQDNKYVLKSLKGYDMFPQTPHVETLAILELQQV